MTTEQFTAFIDGASSGNPGHSGIGVVIYKGKEQILMESKYIGETTNNVAEYSALLHLLEVAQKHGIKTLKVFSDSELMVKQMNGEYKIRDERLKELASKAVSMKKHIKFELSHIPRESNKEADKLSKEGSKRGGKLI
ncbi:MAG: ribonuclease HI family protein [Spirochaetia bacterium]|nr:ribonuclease HI family protein [Spirochaetia bacterium]